MKLIQRDGFWHVKVKDPKGRQWKRFSTGVKADRAQKDAELAASDVLRKFYTSTSVSPQIARSVGTIFNLAEALERCYVTKWQKTKSDIQLKYVVRRMEREIGHWLLVEINFNKLEQYQQDLLKGGLTPATVNRRMSLIKVTLKHCHQKGDVLAMPAFPETLAENNIKERYLSEDEEAAIHEWLKKKSMAELYTPGSGTQWSYMRSLAVFLLDTGCRLSEALTLTKTDGRVVHLTHGTTKSNKARVIPLTPRAAKSVELMLANPLHGNVDTDWIGHRWGLVRRECKVEDVNIHVLRHTCASRLLARGVDLYTVSKWLGHSSVKITERYAHLSQGALEQAAAALSRAPVPVSSGTRDPQPSRVRK